MAKYKVLVTGIVLKDNTFAMGGTSVDEEKILGDIDALVKGKYIEAVKSAPANTGKGKGKDDAAAAQKAHDDLLAAYKAKFNADAPDTASDEDVQAAIDKDEEIPVV